MEKALPSRGGRGVMIITIPARGNSAEGKSDGQPKKKRRKSGPEVLRRTVLAAAL